MSQAGKYADCEICEYMAYQDVADEELRALRHRLALADAVIAKLPRCEHRVWQGPPCYEFALYLDAGKWLCREHVMNLNSELPYRAALLALNEVKT